MRRLLISRELNQDVRTYARVFQEILRPLQPYFHSQFSVSFVKIAVYAVQNCSYICRFVIESLFIVVLYSIYKFEIFSFHLVG